MQDDSNNSSLQNHATEVENSSSYWKQQSQNCVPVMIEHLNRYGEDLKIWGMSARNIQLLAVVDEIEVLSTRVNFKFHDETGSIKGLKWLDGDMPYDLPVKLNSYVKVHGTMRKQQNESYVMIASIQPMKNLNELSVHLMEVTMVCLQAENIASRQPQNNSSTIDNNPTMDTNSSVSTGISNGNNQFNQYSDMPKDQVLILEIISRGDPEYGAERTQIKSEVPRNLVPKVDEILEFLSSEGHIYTTKTDDHFKLI